MRSVYAAVLTAAGILLAACTTAPMEDSAPLSTSAPPRESQPIPSVPQSGPSDEHGYVFEMGLAVGLQNNTGAVVAIDVATGSTTELATIETTDRAVGRFQLGQNGTDVYFDVLAGDDRTSCATSRGEVVRLNLLTGLTTTIGAGREPRISPDGSRLAYRAASTCVRHSSGSVHTPADTVVVLDLSSGSETRWLDPWFISSADDTDFDHLRAEPRGLAWLDDSHVQVGDTVVAFGDGSSSRADCHLLPGVDAHARWVVVGFNQLTGHVLEELNRPSGDTPNGLLFEQACEPSASGFAIATAPEELIAALDRTGTNLLLVLDGTTLVAGDSRVELDRHIDNVAW